ncbi:MAG TPA: transcription termination/antitermination NusG family protein [Phycisphaerae bacterium]|nr:transcription termination/antitermination NusG family protein [Phycisphaerae bacterium]
MLKLSDNPPLLSPSVESVADLPGRWWVAHTRARQEKALAWDLLGRGIGYFLPMSECVTYSGGRKRRVMRPLFTSYLFLCGQDSDRYAAMTTNRVFQTINVVDQANLVAELTALERALAGDAELAPCLLPEVGRRCRVTAGPFKDTEGVVIEHGKRARLVLSVSILGQGAAMEIDASLLQSID